MHYVFHIVNLAKRKQARFSNSAEIRIQIRTKLKSENLKGHHEVQKNDKVETDLKALGHKAAERVCLLETMMRSLEHLNATMNLLVQTGSEKG
jgi:hypothetical protein